MILIAGCGFLGSYLAKHIVSETNEKIIATTRNKANLRPLARVEYIECDITKKADLCALKKVTGNEPLTVYWFAACHNIDYIFENRDDAYRINITALEAFFAEFTHIEKFFFASTDCVYGENLPVSEKFTESFVLTPVNEYGRQKILAEKLVLEKGFTVLRYPFMLGESLTDKKHFYDNICQNLKNGTVTEMIDGMYRNVLSYRQAAELTYELSLKTELPQIINLCADRAMSKYEMGLILAKKHGADERLIKKITPLQGQKFFKDKRADCTYMDNSLLKKLTGRDKIIWEEEGC